MGEGQGSGSQGLSVPTPSPQPPSSPMTMQRIQDDLEDLELDEVEQILTSEEKRFLLYVERGDVASVRHILKKAKKENKKKAGSFNLNCVDPLGRSGVVVAVENENLDMILLLLDEGVLAEDALFYAIAEEYVEGVEALLGHEEKIHVAGEAYSWQRKESEKANFTGDITPLILAAHKNNYEIIKLLLDRGATLPMPHDIRCACDECLISSSEDSLRHSLARINAYRALASPSLICLSSKDPLITAFSLSDDLDKLATLEYEFRDEYTALRTQVLEFAMRLVDETRSSDELEIILNYDPEGEPYQKGQFMHLNRLKDAVDNNQKQFVAHASVQQLLGTVWYDGMPGFKRRSLPDQLMAVVKIGVLFPVYCMSFLLAPKTSFGGSMKKPFIKFIVHSSSYCCFLLLLVIVSLRLESLIIELFGTTSMVERLHKQERESRGGYPSITELLIVVYVFGFIYGEMKALWNDGLLEYAKDLWNFVDFGSNFFYMNWIFLRLTALFLTTRAVWAGENPYFPREMWPPFDPMLLSEAMFCAGNILSFLKLVHIFSVNPHMGPLQIALGRMVVDIIKFFFIYTLVLFAFGCGLNNLLWYYADIDKGKCYSLPGGLPNPKESQSCEIWRRFSNLFETSQSLFWASFGLVDLINFELTGIKSFTRFWSMLMFGSYNVINVIVLLNLLIAMMSNSYTFIVDKCDVEWKFARSKFWMSYFEEGQELPSPFNLVPKLSALCEFRKPNFRESFKKRQDQMRDDQYQTVMKNLVRRYVTAEQRNADETLITEDDVNEVKQDINSFKYELLNILRINGMMTGNAHHKEDMAVGKKQQARERRLMKGFNIGLVEGIEQSMHFGNKKSKNPLLNIVLKQAAKSEKKDWNSIMRQSKKKRDPIGSSSTSLQRQSLRNNKRCNAAWSKVKFYQKRGVFLGGQIDPRMLREIKNKGQVAPLQSRSQGWRTLQKLHDRGEITQENFDRCVGNTPSPGSTAAPTPIPPTSPTPPLPRVGVYTQSSPCATADDLISAVRGDTLSPHPTPSPKPSPKASNGTSKPFGTGKGWI
ncbi:transient receptor potential protein isoform X1 [Penaeus vannamei]|uniref:transient receptor potential protein isoform X1 n=1 Tax=Penaeus vannamei TaxID=6689 RepID=UPI00387F69ED